MTFHSLTECIEQISNHIALVTSPDGTSMLAVPMSSLVTKGNVNIKPSLGPVPISTAALKAKPPIITPLKILPLIASTTSSNTITVPTISHSKNIQTLIGPNSVSIAKGLVTPGVSATNTGVTLIPKSVISLTSNEILSEQTSTSSMSSTSLSQTKEKSETLSSGINNWFLIDFNTFFSDETEDKIQSPLPPPLLSQSTSITAVGIGNSQTLSPPTLTPVLIGNPNTIPKSESQNKNKSPESDSVSNTGIEEMDSVIQIMEWKDGIGVLPGSDLKFRIDDLGHLDMINEPESDTFVKNGIKTEVKEEKSCSETPIPEEVDKIDSINDLIEKTDDETEPMLTCINCGQRGPSHTFIRQGRFCSKSCATLEANQLKLITKRNAELKAQENEKKKFSKRIENSKGRKQFVEQTEQNSILFHTENSNQTIEEMESNGDLNEEVEDVETDADNSTNGPQFSWRQYLNKTNSMAAPVKCFSENQSFPSIKNGFKVGMKLEGVDPQHPSKFCILTVAEVLGFRIRLHFDGYKDLFDFWVNSDHNFIFAAGFCEQTGRKLEPPAGMAPEEFNWNDYLLQTKSVAAPKHLFSTNNWQPSSVSRDGFKKGMKLEAVDRANSALVCVATVADIIDNWLLIHFDGWDDSYDYWAETSSPFIHSINWFVILNKFLIFFSLNLFEIRCRTKGRSLTPPKAYYRSSERFSWEEYLSETKSMAVSIRSFRSRASNNFKVGMKLEAVDKRNPRLIRVSTISHRQSHSIKLHFDGWDEKYDYWVINDLTFHSLQQNYQKSLPLKVDDDCPDLHPVNWCHKTSHPLQPPPGLSPIK